MQIVYQMRLGWVSKDMHDRLRQQFVDKGGKDDSMFPQTLTRVIFTLDNAKDDNSDTRKLQDGIRNGLHDGRNSN